jgi:hypothetical protein
MAALILPLIFNKNGAVYDSTVGVISRLLQSDVAKAGDPQRASEILVRVVKREHLPSHLPKAMCYSLLRAGVDARAVNRIRIYNLRRAM